MLIYWCNQAVVLQIKALGGRYEMSPVRYGDMQMFIAELKKKATKKGVHIRVSPEAENLYCYDVKICHSVIKNFS